MHRSIGIITLALSALVLLASCASTSQSAKTSSDDSTTRVARMSEQARLDQAQRLRDSAAESRQTGRLDRRL